MAYSNYRGGWIRDRDERSRGPGGRERDQQQWQGDEERDIDDSRRARESMRDQFSYEGRGGYGGGSGRMMGSEEQGSRYGQDFSQRGYERGYGQGDYGQEFGRGGEGRGHYGNESGGWQGREREQWRNRGAHGDYDRNANYGGYSSSGTGNYAGYGGSGGSYQGSGQLGPHRGRGPRGYRRSDDRIKEDVCDCLTEDDRLDATDIEIVVKDGEVQLTGFVASREEKRWAEALAERISGVKDVQNSLRVQDQQRNQSTGAAAAASGGVATPGKDKGKDIQH